MKSMKIIMGILAAALMSGPASAADSFNSVGGQAQPLSQSGGTARAMSMGSAVVAVPQGSASLLWNPAGLSTMTCTEIGLHHNSGLGSAVQETLVFGMPVGSGGVAASFNYVDNGSFEGRDIVGNPTADYHASAMGGSLGWGTRLVKNLSGGVAVRGNWQRLAGKTYPAYASDLGLMWTPSAPLSLGMTYSNINLHHNVAGYSMAQGWRLGASYNLRTSVPEKPLLLAMAFEKQDIGVTRTQFGFEDWVSTAVALRAGYQWNSPSNELTGFTNLTVGLGLKLNAFLLDYAYVPLGDLGASHRLSLTFKFDCEKCKKAVAEEETLPVVEKTGVKETVLVAINLSDTHFDFDSAAINPSAKAILREHIQILKENPKATIRVSGYTSAMGTEEYNQKLSERRAVSVREFLLKEGGIAPGRITTVGYGETRPAEFEANPERKGTHAAVANKRVHFKIVVR